MYRLFSLPIKISHICGQFGSNVSSIGAKVCPNGHQLMSGNVDDSMVMVKRGVVYYSHSRGQFRDNRAVLMRFYRLNWGAWIRPRAGRRKHLWSKPYWLKWWTKQHVFCTDEHNKVLDQMVGAYYKRPTHFIDDPYEPYQKRNDFPFVPLGRNSVSTSYINTLYEYKSSKS